jgi:hypothetical protein
MTRIVAVLSWFDESPDMLRDMVLSLPLAGVDALVAVDGAFEHFAGNGYKSPREQVDAIYDAAQQIGVTSSCSIPGSRWRNEPEKRSYAFRLAEGRKPDWYLVLDSDERILAAPPDLKDRLAETDKDVVEGMLLEAQATTWSAEFDDEEGLPAIHAQRFVKPRRCLIRAIPGLRCGPRHFDYVTPDGRNLWGDTYGSPLLMRDLVIDHRNHERNKARADAAWEYYRVRDELGLEKC